MINVKKIVIASIGFVFIFIGSWGWAQASYPNKPIQIIIPYAPGGVMDISTRLTAAKMTEYLGQPVIEVNKPGGGSVIGISYVGTSTPDGYTLLLTTGGGGSFELMTLMMPNCPYKVSDFIPIGALVEFTLMIAVHKDIPVKTLAELGDYIRKNPGTMSCSTPGVGSLTHLLFELLRSTLKVQDDIEHIPYTGLTEALKAVLGNHSQVTCLPFTSLVTKHIKSNELRGLAVFSRQRDPFLPQVPTAIEQGFEEMEVVNHYAFYAPVKTPAPIIRKIEEALEKAAQDKELREKLKALEVIVKFKDSRKCLGFQDDSIKKWGSVIKKGNFIIK